MSIIALWLPILAAGVAVFVVSGILWMALPIHKPDIRMLPDQDAFDRAVSPLGLKPGLYMFPNCADAKAMKDESFQKRWAAGPWGTINVMGVQPNFARNLGLTFITFLVGSFLVAYLSTIALAPGSDGHTVFRFTFTTALLGYALGGLPNAFFLGTPTRFILTSTLDAALYALTTALVFMLLWPG
ncbi:MAG: hypothetical protein H6810_03515 [Phycisphaeraceae bacterium]|nr:MAG: hypothetical protein H6810_03515 [Phycisphaeraceae bacterium]